MAEIIGNIANTVKDGVNYVADTIAGNSAEAKAEVNKQEIKSDQTSLGQKVSAAGDYISNKSDESTNKASAELNKQKAQN